MSESSMYMAVMPPGDREQLICEDCSGTHFQLCSESWDGKIGAFHTVCTTCGKRGQLVSEVTTTQTRKFVQFYDPPPSTITMTIKPDPRTSYVTGTDEA